MQILGGKIQIFKIYLWIKNLNNPNRQNLSFSNGKKAESSGVALLVVKGSK